MIALKKSWMVTKINPLCKRNICTNHLIDTEIFHRQVKYLTCWWFNVMNNGFPRKYMVTKNFEKWITLYGLENEQWDRRKSIKDLLDFGLKQIIVVRYNTQHVVHLYATDSRCTVRGSPQLTPSASPAHQLKPIDRSVPYTANYSLSRLILKPHPLPRWLAHCSLTFRGSFRGRRRDRKGSSLPVKQHCFRLSTTSSYVVSPKGQF